MCPPGIMHLQFYHLFFRLRNKPKRGPPGFGASYKGGGASGATLPPKMMALPQQQTPFMMNANPGPIPDIPQIKVR